MVCRHGVYPVMDTAVQCSSLLLCARAHPTHFGCSQIPVTRYRTITNASCTKIGNFSAFKEKKSGRISANNQELGITSVRSPPEEPKKFEKCPYATRAEDAKEVSWGSLTVRRFAHFRPMCIVSSRSPTSEPVAGISLHRVGRAP